MNIVILHGRLTADPTIRQSNSGKSIAGFTVAVDGFKDKDGNKQTDFIRCSAFGQTAELMGRYFTKGKEIAVEGSLHPNDYTDDKGVKHFSYQVNVNRVHFCGSKADNQQQNSNPADKPDFGEYEEVLNDGEIPF
jgi:single-strand DNA-binding protein